MTKDDVAQKMNPTKIVIIRHGQTAYNKEKRIRGWSDVPLDNEGREQVKRTAHKLESKKLDGLIASDLDRTQETAAIIASITGLPILKVTKDFRPWHLGDLTGEPIEQAHPIMKKYAQDYPDETIQGGESFDAFKSRFLTGIERVLKNYPGQTIGIVTHHRGDRIFNAWKKKGFPSSFDVDMSVFLQEGIDPGDFEDPVAVIISPQRSKHK